MRKTVIEISLIVNYKLNYKDDNIKLHMKSFSGCTGAKSYSQIFSRHSSWVPNIHIIYTNTHIQRVNRCAVP